MALLVAVRVWITGSPFGLFLAWNLVLAAVPLVASTALVHLEGRGAPRLLLLGLGAVWLAFLPNAPYILTDLVHLQARPFVPFWYDLGMLLSAAGVGLLSGYISLADVQSVIARRWGSVWAWVASVGALFLSAFGVYLGRVLRWNSWDVLAAPKHLARDVAHLALNPLGSLNLLVMVTVFGGMLTLGYVVLYALTTPAGERS